MRAADDDGAQGRGLRRRDALLVAGGAAAGAGVLAAGLGAAAGLSGPPDHPAPSATVTAPAAPRLRRFRSSQVVAPEVTVVRTTRDPLGTGLILTTPQTDVQIGVILDDAGEPVWIDPERRAVSDLRVQTYRDEPVLTFWSGRTLLGNGLGAGTVLDTSYRHVATVRAGNGAAADLHEFTLTPDGTALMTSYPIVPADLRSIGGPAAGWVNDCRVQEVDVASGRVRFDWSAAEHIPITETYQPRTARAGGSGLAPETPFDPWHVNAIEPDGDRFIISARHTHALYSLDRGSGRIQWRMGGRRSDFTIPREASFAWQHDPRLHAGNRLSLFNNAKKVPPGESWGLLLEVDEARRTVALVQQYRNARFGFAEGSTQLLDGGNVLVGWGKGPFATEFTADGRPIWELQGLGSETYRVYRQPWTGRPATLPDLAVTRTATGLQVHASWNGSTETASWRVEAGADAGSLSTVATVARSGFETTARIPAAAVVRVRALQADGDVIGTSRTIAV